MSENKRTVQRYMDAFTKPDHARILACLTDGEENDIVVAEGTVRARRADGGDLDAVFCDLFIMHGGKIKQLTSYVVVTK